MLALPIFTSTQFAKGYVLLKIGEKKYESRIIVGYTTTKEMVLYDIQDLKPKNFSIKEKKTQPTLAGNESDTRKTVTPSKDSISNNDQNVKRKFSVSSAENVKKAEA